MIKKLLDFIYKLSLIILIVFEWVMAPINVNAAKAIKDTDTIADLKSYYKELQNKKNSNTQAKKKTQAEINAAKTSLANTKAEIENAEKEIEELTARIADSDSEITDLKKETEGLLVQYQKQENTSIYMEYITGASTITELIMRMDAINLIAEYNKEKLLELELLIENNKKMSVELAKYQVELEEKTEQYRSQIDSLNDDLSELVEGAESIDSEIKSIKESIAYYEGIGCKDDQTIAECLNISDNKVLIKPLNKGKITSPFGYRIHPITKKTNFHSGIDIAGNPEGTNVYAPASGVVGKITRKSSCGGNIVYLWVYVNGTPYTLAFMHLLEIKVKLGESVTPTTVIGLVGGTSTKSYDKCTTGAHLHYSVSKGNHYLKTKSETYSKYTSNLINPPNFPSLGSWFYSRY